MLLAGDIGATKTVLAVFSPETGPRVPLSETTFQSTRYHSLRDIVHEFLAQVKMPVTAASFGLAGPVMGSRATITNLSWVIEAQEYQKEFKFSTMLLLNDLESIAHSIPLLKPEDLHTLDAGKPVERGSIAVIAPGTGLGEAFLTWDGRDYHPHATEGGHTDFGPRNSQELDLLRYLLARYDHVSYERVCSGMGLPNIYAFLKESGFAEEPAWLAEKLAGAEDPTPVIVTNALDAKAACKLCSATLDIFVSVLGAETGNLALKTFSSGGVYVAGGIPPKILPALEDGRFMQAFHAKGRLSHVVANMPVHVILNPKVALLGAARAGLEAALMPNA